MQSDWWAARLSVEIRKVQRTPDGTFFLSIPKGWANRFNLAKGSALYLRERSDGCLIIDPQFASETSPEITIEISPTLEDDILSSYLLGFETINLSGHKISAKDRQRIKRTITRLIGAEIVEETTERVVVQCLLKVTAFPPDKILRRGCLLSSSLVSDAFSAFLRGDKQLAESILERDEEVDRLYFLIVRLLRALIVNPRLSEKLNVSLIGCLDYRLIASLVETIADQAVEIAMLTLKFPQGALPPRTAKQFELLTQRIMVAYEEVVKTIFAAEEKALATATAKRLEAHEQLRLVEAELNGIKPGPPVAAVRGFATVKRIFDCISDIIDLVTPKSRLEKGLQP